MVLHSAFKDFHLDTLARLNDPANPIRFMKNLKPVASCLNPLHSYVDMMNLRLLSYCLAGVQPNDSNFLVGAKLTEYLRDVNDLIPRVTSGVKCAKDIHLNTTGQTDKSSSLVLAINKSFIGVFVDYENAVNLIELNDKQYKIAFPSEGYLKISKLEKKSKKKKPAGSEEEKRKVLDICIGERVDVKLIPTKDLFFDVQLDMI